MANLDPTSVQYQEAHLRDSRVVNIIVTMAVCCPAAYLALILRIASRRIGKVPCGADDWCVFLATVSPGLHLLFH